MTRWFIGHGSGGYLRLEVADRGLRSVTRANRIDGERLLHSGARKHPSLLDVGRVGAQKTVSRSTQTINGGRLRSRPLALEGFCALTAARLQSVAASSASGAARRCRKHALGCDLGLHEDLRDLSRVNRHYGSSPSCGIIVYAIGRPGTAVESGTSVGAM